ncbi:MED14-domain-containing protein [Abortiporus biennis]|nr:MED14-domain-containing protein [Abortiporus biennis]
MNGSSSNGHLEQSLDGPSVPLLNGFHEPTQEELERELPVVQDGQIPLGELVSRMVQTIYAELVELAETMPNMSDTQRKRTLAEWVVKTKKQVVKLYAVVRWSRDAGLVQKAMNVTAFLMDQNRQFEDSIHGLTYAKTSLDPARLRNHDLLTSLDVLTTGSYRRLSSAIKKAVIPVTPLTDEEVAKTLSQMEHVMLYRLRMSEIIPLEMAKYRVDGGRVHFTAPKLFEASLCLRGAKKEDGWFFVDVEFLFTVGGDPTGMQEFPRIPTGYLKRHIADEADRRLAYYLPLPEEQPPPPPGVEIPPQPQLPDGVADTPLVRVFNFLQMMSMSYQLEILWYQAERMRSLGWADYMKVEMTNSRKTLTISYWIRPSPPSNRPLPPSQTRLKLPPFGGTLSISIVPTQPAPPLQPSQSASSSQPSHSQRPFLPSQSQSQTQTRQQQQASTAPVYPPKRSARAQVLAELQERSKLGSRSKPSDDVEGLKFEVKWEIQKNVLGVVIPPEAVYIPENELKVNSDDLDVETLLKKVIAQHTRGLLLMFQYQLQQGLTRNVFGHPGTVNLITENNSSSLHVHLCADEVVVLTIDPRTGRLVARDTGDLAAAGRGPKFNALSDRLNDNPVMLPQVLVTLRIHTITDLAEQKAKYLGLQSSRTRNFAPNEIQKFGRDARGNLYIKLSNFPSHYLVLVITDGDFKYALISVKRLEQTMFGDLELVDIGWLDVKRIHGGEITVNQRDVKMPSIGEKRKRDAGDGGVVDAIGESYPSHRFRLETQVLRELYAYCCARVAYTKVEQQLKTQEIAYTHVNPSRDGPLPIEISHTQSSLARSIPALCVQASDILSGAPAAEAAMRNIRVIPLNWWSDQPVQVVTCVKLKYVQQPIGKRAETAAVIRPSKRIIYDTTEAVVCFLSEDVDKCVDEFLEEWARVSKMVVIAREVAQMATEKNWKDVRLLSFDLQTVEFAYSMDYTVSITCIDQLSSNGGSYQLRFSRVNSTKMQDTTRPVDLYNPHSYVEPFLRNILRHGRLAPSLHRLVSLLRDTLPIVLELQDIRESAMKLKDIVDTYAKASGWFRVLYGDLRHALDFRLMTNARVLILDGSHSLFHVDEDKVHPGVSLRERDLRFTTPWKENMEVLQPIPGFRDIIAEVMKEVTSQDSSHKMTAVDVGVICDARGVRLVGRTLYERVVKCLQSESEKGKEATVSS